MAKILLIDDDSEFLDMLSLLMERAGHTVVLSADGPDGLEKARTELPDMAIIDVMMPDMTGYEVVRELRANPVTASIPVLILTARGQPVDRQAALDAGADDYMSKPVTMADLDERVEELLAKNTSVRSTSAKGTLVLLSLRGGVGVTTLAANLATLLAHAGDRAACLVDLCSSSGHAALQLGLRPKPSWADLVEDITALDSHLLEHSSGLRLLASPLAPSVGSRPLSEQVTRSILSNLQREFLFVVVDTPSVLDEATMVAIELASVVGLVVLSEPPSIQAAVGTLRVLDRWKDKFYVVVNQISSGAPPPIAAIQRTLKRPVIGLIPFDAEQAHSLSQGALQAQRNPTSPMVQAVQKLAQSLMQAAGKSVSRA
jgi:pilus assembly protein CpaE